MKTTRCILSGSAVAALLAFGAEPGNAQTETFDDAGSAAAHGWTGFQNTVFNNNFGFSLTDNTLGSSPAGEAGGTFYRNIQAQVGYYADLTIGGGLTANDPLQASGEVKYFANTPANNTVVVGHLGLSGFDGVKKNHIGLEFIEGPRAWAVIYFADGTRRQSGIQDIDVAQVALWDYNYDPNGNGGLGVLTANLRDSGGTVLYSFTDNLAAGDKSRGLVLDAFGMVETPDSAADRYTSRWTNWRRCARR